MEFTTVFFDIDYCLLDTPASERRIIRELYATQGQILGDEVGDAYREKLYVMRFQRLLCRRRCGGHEAEPCVF